MNILKEGWNEKIKTLTEWFQNKFSPTLARISNMKYLIALRDGMIITVPFTIFGSIFMIIANLPINGWNDLIAPIMTKLQAPVTVTFGILALIVALGMSYQTSKVNKIDPLAGTAIGTIAFLICMLNDKFMIDPATLGSSGMFTAIVVAIISSEIMHFFIKRNIVIKMPDSVPPAVSSSFASLIPGGAALLFFWLVRVLFNIQINDVIQAIFSPLVFGLNSFWGMEFVLFLTLLLWTMGIHGNNVVGAVASPVYLQFLTGNINAVSKGQVATHITADGFLNFGMNIGGTGAVLGLVICMLFAKSKQYKQLGRLGFVPAIFQISEPIMFGFPVVLNPTLMIPFISVPMVLQGVTYFLMKYHIIGMVIAQIPWTTPTIINGYLITGGDWRAPVWQIIQLVIATAVYWPFFKICDRAALKAEKLGEV
ncbi:PTS sugar transporter subunit IIC [Latilactobacillus curvatus]|uniref:PTS sugar transporter subunit IIC n=1 Tax=Latilactobacillus curvatus TaxID=28038 RepID=UPI00241102C6|nr:PTS transporter subunit EIIC [Latilactobacillus curvatus]